LLLAIALSGLKPMRSKKGDLHKASQRGDVQAMESCLKNGAKINEMYNGCHCLSEKF